MGIKDFARVMALLVAAFILQANLGCKAASEPQAAAQPNGKAIPRGDLAGLRAQARALESRVKRLEATKNRIFPGGPVILVDTSQSKITLMMGSKVIVQGTCSTGNGMELADAAGKRSWTFDTPRGHFQAIGKVANPVWFRPDWSYIEEGEPIPKNYAHRATANVLGDYAIGFGDGFYIHGTLYTRLLGTNVTHGCIRVDDKVLKQLYAATQPGTHIWIY